MTLDVARLKTWIGRRESREDVAAAWPLAALAATLDRDDPWPKAGDPVPPGGHWLYFLPFARASELGPDGHPKRGGFLPPVELPRRMWAGGRLSFAKPLRVGEAIRRTSEVRDVTVKEGKTGTLAFVLVAHEIADRDGVAIREEHDIVYREAPKPGQPPPKPGPPPADPVWRRTITPDPVMLFRYSALTFNGHRIHYDHPYVTQVEGYPGLVVHGPLIATLLMDLCRRERPDARLAAFAFRAVGPLFDTAPFTVEGRPAAGGASAALWARGPDGALAMTATAEFAAR